MYSVYNFEYDSYSNYNSNLDDMNYSDMFSNNTISKTLQLFDYPEEDMMIETYPYEHSKLNYITNYIYPFWKKEFFKKEQKNNKTDDFNPYASWSKEELSKYNMGLKENTLCFELKLCNVTIGFASILLLDKFDRENILSPFSDKTYEDSLVFYNYVLEEGFRGRGYGTLFFEVILEYIQKTHNKNYNSIVLYVDKENQSAIHIYNRYDFENIGENSKDTSQYVFKKKIENC